MTTISAVIITLNEEENIRNCLKTLEWCDEIIIVDSYSEDETVNIAKEFTDKIIQNETSNGFDYLRKKGIEEASGDWILRVDADEMIPKPLAEHLIGLRNSDFDIVKAPRKNYIFGQWMKKCGWWPDYQTLMFRPEKLKISSEIHEWDSPETNADIKRLEKKEEYAFRHFTRLGSRDFLSHMNKYTSIEAKQTENYSVFSVIFSPIKEFVKRFFIFKGYSAGYRGFMLSMLRMIYVFVAEMKKLERNTLGREEGYRRQYDKEAEKVLEEW